MVHLREKGGMEERTLALVNSKKHRQMMGAHCRGHTGLGQLSPLDQSLLS